MGTIVVVMGSVTGLVVGSKFLFFLPSDGNRFSSADCYNPRSCGLKMANLETQNVFIDTESFDASNLNFEATVFKELVRLAQGGQVRVFLTAVTEPEIRAHIAQRIHQALPRLKSSATRGAC